MQDAVDEQGAAARRATRREFLRLSGRGTILLVAAGAGWLGACDPGPLEPASSLGLRLQPRFSARIIATTGQVVSGSSYVWHVAPDGAACFPLVGGGWSYVSNSEATPGGAGYVRFSSTGQIVGAGPCLAGTTRNCSGGATPWGTWLSCEEVPTGLVWECSPIGIGPAVARPAMGRFAHEAAAADPVNRCVYLTEDVTDGALYRFVPARWGDLSAGILQVLTQVGSALRWATVPDPSGSSTATRNQVAGTRRFSGGEGAAMSKGRLVFTTKGDNRVWSLDPAAMTLTVVYDDDVQVNGVLSGVDNVRTSAEGVIYVVEDGGDMQVVLVRDDGSTFPVVQVVGVSGSEMTGPAFDPSGTRFYFSSQRNPGQTFEVSGPWRDFTTPG